ncbi:discoidin domain-containing protein [Microtetraspora sp. NBRC 13810]|uniref:discoidin domain-containing protein n=1 Tax=Microtetraspora sp. NBRC 13810 TaxID=3030990 RepID=UPI0025533DAF|nr:discoidin domain-containing protein [Microtetraspora sp. NBRC 13810]
MRRPRSAALAVVLATTLTGSLMTAGPATAATPTADQQWARVQQIVGAVKGRWTTPAYSNSITRTMPDTALLGNGDIGVTSGGGNGYKTFYISKGDFWLGGSSPSLVALGSVTITPASGADQSANLALGATATASSSHPSFAPGRAVNGSWGPGYEGWVSNVGKPQTLELDLGTARTFRRYILRHDAAARPAESANTGKDWTLSVSSDRSNWTTVDTVTGNTAAVSDRTFAPVTARYLRLDLTEPTQGTTPDSVSNPRARVGQFELYDTEGPTAPNDPFTEEQNILKGDIETSMTIGGTPVSMKTWTGAEDNVVVTQIRSLGERTVRLQAQTATGSVDARPGFTSTAGVTGDTVWATRETPAGEPWTSRASLASRVVGGAPVGEPAANGPAGQIVFDLPAGQTVNIVTAVAGGGPNPADPAPAARKLAGDQTAGTLGTLYDEHVDWWKRYWLRSYVDLDDDVLERFYYGSLYLLGSSMREGRTAPGLYGIWATSDYPQWGGDMHLNYNWQANYYGVYSSNRPELALPYFDLVQDYLPEARRRSVEDLTRVKPDYIGPRFPSGGIPGGVLFPVGIAPFGATVGDLYHQQVANALFTVTQYISYYDYTQDRDFLVTKGYPFMKEVATFFEHYLEWDAKARQYNLYSGPHEGTWAKNSSPDLGMLKLLLTKVIAAGEELKKDAKSRRTWQKILKHLPATPTTVYNGKTVYALADPGTVSDGRDIRPGDNTVNLEFVHPGEQLGIGSPQADRQRAIDTIDVMNSWGQENSFPKIFTQAARVGYPAQTLVDRLKGQITQRMAPNLRIADGNHGLEKAGAIEAIDNMMLQSFDGVVHVFPVWPAGKNGSFVKLREKGGLVVSSEISGGKVTYVDITAEAGGDVRLANPWPGQKVRITRVGTRQVDYAAGKDVIKISAKKGATYTITPV